MKKILLSVYITATVLVIVLHMQTIPFILLVLLGVILSAIYYRQKKRQKLEFTVLTQEKESATVQLQALSTQTDSGLLFKALAGIQQRIISNEISKSVKHVPRIALPLFGETRYVSIDNIIRCEADNTYTKFMLANGEEVLISKTLKEFTNVLEKHGFVRSHQSHLINITFIKSWLKEDNGYLLLTDGNKIPVSKLNKDKVKEILANAFN